MMTCVGCPEYLVFDRKIPDTFKYMSCTNEDRTTKQLVFIFFGYYANFVWNASTLSSFKWNESTQKHQIWIKHKPQALIMAKGQTDPVQKKGVVSFEWFRATRERNCARVNPTWICNDNNNSMIKKETSQIPKASIYVSMRFALLYGIVNFL